MNPLLTGPKRHHLLPISYLKGFTSNGLLSVYDRNLDTIRSQTPKNTLVQGHFYTLEDKQGRKRYEAEKVLSDYESNGINALRKLESKKKLNVDERVRLSLFVALATTRQPEFIDKIKKFNVDIMRKVIMNVSQNKEHLKGYLKEIDDAPQSEEDLDRLAQNMIEMAKSGKYSLEADHSHAVSAAIDVVRHVSPVLFHRNWTVIHSRNESDSFVTTDSPVVLTSKEQRKPAMLGIGFGNLDAVIVFPLTASCVIIMQDAGEKLVHKTVEKKEIHHINLFVASRYHRFLIGQSDVLVRSLSKRIN